MKFFFYMKHFSEVSNSTIADLVGFYNLRQALFMEFAEHPVILLQIFHSMISWHPGSFW